MSVIQRIREKAAWFVFGAIALSLVAFILQDAFKPGKGSMFSDSSTVGKVNGMSIDRTDFEDKLTFYEQANGTKREELIGSLWDYMVEQSVLEQEYNKLGLQYTSKELSDALFGANPPSWMQQAFTDPATGIYNADAARQQFSQMKKNANDPKITQVYQGYLDPTIQQGLRTKYQSMITGAVYIPKWLAEKTSTDNNSIAKISYVNVPYTAISDSSFKVSNDEIVAFIKKHSKQFEQKGENRMISYVSFNASANKEDSLAVLAQLEQLKSQFAAATDDKSFLAKNGTEMPFYNSYISKSAMKQKVNDSLFALAPGSVYGPYVDEGNYVLSKMIDVRQMPDSVKVRHILVSTHQPQQTGELVRVRADSSASKRLDSAIALINSGAGFDSVAMVYSDDPGSKDKGGVYDYFPSGQMVEQFNDFVFTGKPGDKQAVHTSFGYHYIEILDQKGSSPAYKIAYLAKPIVASQETINAANTAATTFAANNRDRKQFNVSAAKLNKVPLAANNIKQNDFSIQGLGDSRSLVRWIYENKEGDISEPFQVDDKYVVALITGISKPGLVGVAEARPLVEPQVRNEKKAQQIIKTKIRGNTLEEIAKSAGVSVQAADSISFQGAIIPNVGNEIKIIGASFNKQIQNKLSEPIAGTTGVFVIRGNGVFAGSSLSSNPETIREASQTQLKSQVSYRSLTALKEAADVKDYRAQFY